MTCDRKIGSPIPARILTLVRRLVWLQLGLALTAIALALLPFCGRCGSGSWTHLAIAGGGVLGYAGLLLLGRKGVTTPVTIGLYAAGGIHAALGGIMVMTGSFCIVCTVSALVASSNVALILFGVPRSVKWLPRVLVPFLSLTWIVAYVALSSASADARRAKEAASRDLRTLSAATKGISSEAPELVVFEMDGCAYCRLFRNSLAPRLAREFPDLMITFRNAEDVLWVRRVPTIVLGDRVLFEGLPRHDELTRAIAHALPDGTLRSR